MYFIEDQCLNNNIDIVVHRRIVEPNLRIIQVSGQYVYRTVKYNAELVAHEQ